MGENGDIKSLLSFLSEPSQQPGGTTLTENPGFLEGAQSALYNTAAGLAYARALMADTDKELWLHRQAAEEMTRKAASMTNEASLANLFGSGAAFLASAVSGMGAGAAAGRLGASALGKLAAGTLGAAAPNMPQAYAENVNTQLEHGVPIEKALSDAVSPAAVSTALDSVAPLMAITKGLLGKPIEKAATADGLLNKLGKLTATEAATGAAQSGVATAGVDDAYQKYDVLSRKGLEEMAKAGMYEAISGFPYLAQASVASSLYNPTPFADPVASEDKANRLPLLNDGDRSFTSTQTNLLPSSTVDTGVGTEPDVLATNQGIDPSSMAFVLSPTTEADNKTEEPTTFGIRSKIAGLLAEASKDKDYLTLKQLRAFSKQVADEAINFAIPVDKQLTNQLMKASRTVTDGKVFYDTSAIATTLDSIFSEKLPAKGENFSLFGYDGVSKSQALPEMAIDPEQHTAVEVVDNPSQMQMFDSEGQVIPSAQVAEQPVAKTRKRNKVASKKPAQQFVTQLTGQTDTVSVEPVESLQTVSDLPAVAEPQAVSDSVLQTKPLQQSSKQQNVESEALVTSPVLTKEYLISYLEDKGLPSSSYDTLFAPFIKGSSKGKQGFRSERGARNAAKLAGLEEYVIIKQGENDYGYSTREQIKESIKLMQSGGTLLSNIDIPQELKTLSGSKKGIMNEWLRKLLERKMPFKDSTSSDPNALPNRLYRFIDDLASDVDEGRVIDPEGLVNKVRDHLDALYDKAIKKGQAEKAEATIEPVRKPVDKQKRSVKEKAVAVPAVDIKEVEDVLKKHAITGKLYEKAKAAVSLPTRESVLNAIDGLLDDYANNDSFSSALDEIYNIVSSSASKVKKVNIPTVQSEVRHITDPEELAKIAQEIKARDAEAGNKRNTAEHVRQILKESRRNEGVFSVDKQVVDPLSFEEVQTLSRQLLNKFPNPPKVEVISRLSEAPLSIRIKAQKAGFDGKEAQVKGFFSNGTLYVVANAHNSKHSIEKTLYHEAFHLGLRRALTGDKLLSIIDKAIASFGGTDGIIKFAKRVGTYDRLLPYIKQLTKDVVEGVRTQKEANRVLFEEALAPLAETNASLKLSTLSKFLGYIAKALDKVGANTPAAWVRKWSPVLVAKTFLDIAKEGFNKNSPNAADEGFMAIADYNQLSASAKEMYESIKNRAEATRAAFNRLPYRTGVRKLAHYLSAVSGKGAVFSARQLVSSTKGMLTSLADAFELDGKTGLAEKLRNMIQRLENIATIQDVMANRYLARATRALDGLSEESKKRTWEVFQLELSPEQASKRLSHREMGAYTELRRTFDAFFDEVLRPAYEREANVLLHDKKPTDSVMKEAAKDGDYVIKEGRFVRVPVGSGTHKLTNYRENYAPRIYDREKIQANAEQFMADLQERTKLTEQQARSIYESIVAQPTEAIQIGQAPLIGLGKSGFQKARNINLPNHVFDGYLSKDLGVVLPVYLNRTISHALFTKEFGRAQTALDGSMFMEPGNEWAEIHNSLQSEEDRAVFRRIMNTLTHKTGLTDSSFSRTLSSGLRAFGSVMMMSLILLKSFGDVAWIVAAGKNGLERDAAKKALMDLVKSLHQKEKARSIAANRIFYQHAGLVTSAAMDRLLADLTDIASTEGWEGRFNRFTTKFYQRTGIHHFTTVLRNLALDAGQIAVNHAIAILEDNETTDKEKAEAADTLQRFGVDIGKWRLWEKAGKPTPTQALEIGDEALLDATNMVVGVLAKFRNSSVAHPTQLDKTVWADSAIGKLFWQFHGYFYALQNNVMTRFFDNIKEHKFKEAFKQIAAYIPIAMLLGGVGLYTAHFLQYQVPAVVFDYPVWSHSLTTMGLGDAAVEALKYTALSGFAAESWSTAMSMPGGVFDITNLAPSVGLAVRLFEVDSLTSAPTDVIDNASKLVDNLIMAAIMYKVVGAKLDQLADKRQKEFNKLTAN